MRLTVIVVAFGWLLTDSRGQSWPSPARYALPAFKRVQQLIEALPPACAPPPSADFLYPSGGAQGAKLRVVAAGQLYPWPVQMWTDAAGLAFRSDVSNGVFEATIGPDVPAGPHLVRLFNPYGASAPRVFVVGNCTEELEREPNDHPGQAQAVPDPPVTLNGRLDREGDVDVFAVKLLEKSRFTATLDGWRLDSPVDLTLTLLDPQGQPLVNNDDRQGFDPVITAQCVQAGTYHVLVAASSDRGKAGAVTRPGEAAVYRLTLISQANDEGRPAIKRTDAMDPEMQRPAGIGWPLELPAGVEGTIDPPGNEDRFRFQARKGEPLCLRLAYASLSSPLRPVLTLRDEAGALVVQQSSVGNQDVELTWAATADGWYVLTLTDAAGNGGPDYAYRLQLGPPAPGFQASLGPHCVRLEAGRTLELPLATWRLFNYEGLLLTLVNDLPAGVTVDTPLVPAQSGEVKITFTATAAAHPTNQPFRVVLAGAGADTPPPRAATIALRGRYAGPGQLLTNETDQLWLTVLPARKP